MTVSEKIRTIYPLHLAKVYEATRLETEPRERVRKLVGLYEETVRTLALYGLAIYNQHAVHDPAVEKARVELARPSLGHWLSLLRALAAALKDAAPDLLIPPLQQVHRQDAIQAAVQQMQAVLDTKGPKKVRHGTFLDILVTFRNRKMGHGQLSMAGARQVADPLQKALDQWLDGLAVLQQRHLVYIGHVEWQDPAYRYSGTDLNAGASLYPFSVQQSAPVTPRQVYLYRPEDDHFVSLYPLIVFDQDTQLLFTYNQLDKQSRPELFCPYEVAGAGGKKTLAVNPGAILGQPSPQPRRVPQPKPKAKQPDPMKTSELPIMRNWFDIIPPHEDIRSGHFDEAVFAADLGDVYAGRAPADYQDPDLFYRKTYTTEGLRGLLQKVHTKLTTGNGPAVIQIQTPFGGGKTHALVTLYHYIKNGNRIKGMLPAGVEPVQAQVAVVGGNHWNPLNGYTSDSLTRHTFWGEIAYQIGGRAGYEQLRANDEALISPGKNDLRAFLEAHQPFVLLFDEILEYINRALDVSVRDRLDASLGTQTFSFFQELTEAVSSLPNGMLVVTLPSSELEDFGPEQQESLARLSKIFGRVESIETPVKGEEVYAVVRRRLFDVERLKRASMREVVHQYCQHYQQNRDDVPAKAWDVNYRDKMELAYPFHPDVIDILYEKWSTFSSFQRTRGVLRLLANVVEDLYQREANIDLILPGDINLDRPAIRQEFLKHIGSEYEGIIGSDIAGHEAKSPMLDSANRQWKHLAQRIATAIFFHSFSADDSEKGVNLSYIKLATMRSQELPAMITEVLKRLENTLWYLNSRGDGYYFSHIPNLNRMILDKKELFNEAYEEELRQIIQKELGSKFRNYLWPENGDGIPDNRELKLVILHPTDNGSQIPRWLERKGESFREYKNTLFFAVAEASAFGRMRDAVKTYLALLDIQQEVKANPDSPLAVKRDDIKHRLGNVKRDFSYNVRRMYHHLHLGDRTVDIGQPVAGAETLDHWYWRELTSSDIGAIVEQLHYRILVNKFLSNDEPVSTGALLDQFYKNLNLPVVSQPEVVARALQLGIQDKALGLIQMEGDSLLNDTLKFGESIPLDAVSFEPGFAVLGKVGCERILAEIAASQPVLISPEEEELVGGRGGAGVLPTPGDIGDSGREITQPSGGVTNQRYHQVHLVISGIPASKIADVNRGIFIPIKNGVGEFSFTLTLDVTSDDGISQSVLDNQIKETIRQIGARLEEEELG